MFGKSIGQSGTGVGLLLLAAGVEDRIELRIGPAMETLTGLPPEARFDLAFVDADKESYIDYYEALLPRLEPNRLILVDNTLWDGKPADPGRHDADTDAIRSFNEKLLGDDRVHLSLVPIADGLTLALKR